MSKVMILSRDDCRYCADAKGFLTGMDIPFEEQHKPEGAVPQIYIDGRLVGGYSDLIDMSRTPEWDTYFNEGQ